MVEQFTYSKNLRLLSLGGIANVTKNMFVWEYGHDILIIDCGIGFPDEPATKEELLIPDFSYLFAHRHKIRGLVVSHAHFDHYGAIPYLLEKIKIPIYASPLTQEFIKYKLEEFGIKPKDIDFRTITDKDNNIKIGAFQLTPFHVNHSVPQTLGLFLKTPLGNIFHVADYKFDWTPTEGGPFDLQKASWLAAQGKPLILLSDCLGAAKRGHTHSEVEIREVFENLMIRSSGLVLVTTVSSNISRIKQAIQAAVSVGRKVAFLGRSLEQSCQIAQKLGYFAGLKNLFIPLKRVKSFPPQKLVLVAAGSYGQEDSALVKISQGKHPLVKLKEQDVVIFSADPTPPGVIVEVNRLIDNLSKIGSKVYYYEIQENLHVSGHGTAEDIKMLFALVKPQYLLPIGGDFRHMRAYQSLALKMGWQKDKIILAKEGQVIELTPQREVIVK